MGNIRAHICFFSSHLSRLNPNQYPNQNPNKPTLQTVKSRTVAAKLIFSRFSENSFPDYAKTQFEKAKIICKTLIEIIENLESRQT